MLTSTFMDNLMLPINIMHMSVENPERAHTDIERTCKLHQGLGIKPSCSNTDSANPLMINCLKQEQSHQSNFAFSQQKKKRLIRLIKKG